MKKWIFNISKESEWPLTPKSFECRDIQLGTNLIGSLSISGSGNIEKEIKEMLGNRRYTLKRGKLAINENNVVLSNKCSAQIGSGDNDGVSQILRNALPIA